jgi:hypothetical protein
MRRRRRARPISHLCFRLTTSNQTASCSWQTERLSLMSETERALKQSANTHVDTGVSVPLISSVHVL